MNDYYSFNNRYFITAELVMNRPLHIGRGISLEPTGTDLPIVKTPDGQPYIPGSSIKGVVRSELERILRTLDSKKIRLGNNRMWACNIFAEEEKCINKEVKENLEKESKDDEELTQKIIEKSCTACLLFGSTEIASKIYFKDIFLSNESISVKTEIRDGVAIDRDTGTAKKRAKFDYEIVPSGTSFKFEAILENVEPWEVGLLGLVLKMWEKGEIAVGGKTSAGLGWGKLENIIVEKVESKGLLNYLIDNKKEPVSLDSLIEELKSKLKKEEADKNA